MAEKPILNKKVQLKKIPGKGGWTYAELPGLFSDKKKSFGWSRVKGSIDGFKISQYNLMPLSGGGMFLPVKNEIRKKIGKHEGDFVHVILYKDSSEFIVPDELMVCLEDEPKALYNFNKLSLSEQRLYVLHIFSAKRTETRSKRIVQCIDKLMKGLKVHEKDPNQ